jgi:bisphosphoglycerate-independent phosphoglycerate mutase (AlkP superfamily)
MKRHNDIQKKQLPIVRGIVSGVTHLLHLVADMDKRGVSEVVHHGEVNGKTKDGRDVEVKYGYGVKVGLDDFVKKLKAKS